VVAIAQKDVRQNRDMNNFNRKLLLSGCLFAASVHVSWSAPINRAYAEVGTSATITFDAIAGVTIAEQSRNFGFAYHVTEGFGSVYTELEAASVQTLANGWRLSGGDFTLAAPCGGCGRGVISFGSIELIITNTNNFDVLLPLTVDYTAHGHAETTPGTGSPEARARSDFFGPFGLDRRYSQYPLGLIGSLSLSGDYNKVGTVTADLLIPANASITPGFAAVSFGVASIPEPTTVALTAIPLLLALALKRRLAS
jgi:hypothetical protein